MFSFRGKKALKEASELVKTKLAGEPLVLKISGIGSFGSRVVFANVSDGLNELQSVAGEYVMSIQFCAI